MAPVYFIMNYFVWKKILKKKIIFFLKNFGLFYHFIFYIFISRPFQLLYDNMTSNILLLLFNFSTTYIQSFIKSNSLVLVPILHPSLFT